MWFISTFCPHSRSKYIMNWSLRPMYFSNSSNKEPAQKGKHLILHTNFCLYGCSCNRLGLMGHRSLPADTWCNPILTECKRLIRQSISCHFLLLSVVPSKNKVTLLVYLFTRQVNASILNFSSKRGYTAWQDRPL